MISRPIDDGNQLIGDLKFPIVNGYSPQIEEKEQHQPDFLVNREKKHVNMPWESLAESINWVHGMAGERS